jgi:hypothetical protein
MDFVVTSDKCKSDQLNTFVLTFFQISTDLEKSEDKSVQLVRVAFFRSDFLQNPYFNSAVLPAGAI